MVGHSPSPCPLRQISSGILDKALPYSIIFEPELEKWPGLENTHIEGKAHLSLWCRGQSALLPRHARPETGLPGEFKVATLQIASFPTASAAVTPTFAATCRVWRTSTPLANEALLPPHSIHRATRQFGRSNRGGLGLGKSWNW